MLDDQLQLAVLVVRNGGAVALDPGAGDDSALDAVDAAPDVGGVHDAVGA